VSARHKRKRNLFTHNLKLSKTTVAKAAVAVAVPAAVVAGITTSGASAGDSASLLAMAGSQPRARPATAQLDRGMQLTGVARRDVASLAVPRVRVQRAADRRAGAAGRGPRRRAGGRRGYASTVTKPASGNRLSAIAVGKPPEDR
jgi:hypothetical protein